MSALMSLSISDIENGVNAQHIANVFYYQNIATIKRITLVPYIKAIGRFDYKCYQKAYIDIYEWHDSEVAYNFIQRVKNPYKEARIIHNLIDEASWCVEENKLISWLNPENLRGSYTMEFKIVPDFIEQQDEEEWNELKDSIDRELDIDLELGIIVN